MSPSLSGQWVITGDRLLFTGIPDAPFHFSSSLRVAGDLGRRASCSHVEGYLSGAGMGGLPLHHLSQVHGDTLCRVTPGSLPDAGEGDGLYTVDRGALMGVFTADCLAVALVTPEGPAALVHSGWRGTRAGIVPKALAALATLGCGSASITAIFGPSAHACCYAVGPEFRNHFPAAYLEERDGALFFDNQLAVTDQLLQRGVERANVFTNPYCTLCRNDLFYSYRAEGGGAGRILNLLFQNP